MSESWMRRLAPVAALAMASGTAFGLSSVTVNLAGTVLQQTGGNATDGFIWADYIRSSSANALSGNPEFIDAAEGYAYTIDADAITVSAAGGLLEAIVSNVPSAGPNPTLQELFDGIIAELGPIIAILEAFVGEPIEVPDISDLVGLFEGAARNRGSVLPLEIISFSESTDLGGSPISIAADVGILAGGDVAFSVTNVLLPFDEEFLGSLTIETGSISVSTFDTPLQYTDFQMNGDFTPTTSDGSRSLTGGFAEIRYFDDPAFGNPLLGEEEEAVQDPSIPTGITAVQSMFATTTALGIPGVGGEEDTVFCTSVPRNITTESTEPATLGMKLFELTQPELEAEFPLPAGAPGDAERSLEDFNRGIGLAFWANTRPELNAPFLLHWTLVIDLFIPASSVTLPAAGELNVVAPILNDTHDNDKAATVRLLVDENGDFLISWRGEEATAVTLTGVDTGEWVRVAIASNFLNGGSTFYYVDGASVGSQIGFDATDFLYNNLDRTDLTYAGGEAISTADWNSWGQFPNPWARGVEGQQIETTTGLFSSFDGVGEPLYIANLGFVDDQLTATEVSDLGGPDADGIFFPGTTVVACIPDLDPPGGDGALGFFDLVAYLTLFAAMDPAADLDPPGGDGSFGFFDLVAYLTLFAAGCP